MKKRKEIKIINQREANYTFVDAGFTDISKRYSNTEKDMIKSRSVDSMKSKIRYKSRIGGEKL